MDTAGGQAQVKVRCPHCQVIYNIPSSVLEEAGHKVVCSECHNIFGITPPGSPEKPSRKRKRPAKKERDDNMDPEMRDLLSDLERSLERRQPEEIPDSGFLDDLDISPEETVLPDTLPPEDITPPEAGSPEEDMQQDATPPEEASAGKPPPEPPADAMAPEPFISGQPSHRKSASAAVVLLTLLLTLSAGAQLAWLQKDRLLDNPRVRSLAEKVCPYLGCRLPPAEQAQTFRILDRMFEPYIPYLGAYRLNLLLRNDGETARPLPALQLSLLDREQRVMARRTIAASAYATKLPGKDAPVEPGKTLEVHLLLLPPRPGVSGFELRLLPAGT